MDLTYHNQADVKDARRIYPGCWIVEYVNHAGACLLAIPKTEKNLRPLPGHGGKTIADYDGGRLPVINSARRA